MKILVTGREGQVARSLRERASGRDGLSVVAIGRPDLDLTDPESVIRTIGRYEPDIVVSAAAYTAVDRAEDESELASSINREGAQAVSCAAALIGVPVIHLSTDYVFDGRSDRPYAEADTPNPQNTYGRTKYGGEIAVAAANPRHVIFRTSWVYSPFGTNFVKTMLRLAADRHSVSVVCDQWGNPTSALDIADCILHVAAALGGHPPSSSSFGTFHLAGSGSTNWSGFAEHIFAESRAIGGPWASVKPIPSSDYPTRATRPTSSRLATDKLLRTYGWQTPREDSCRVVVERLVREREAASA